MYKKQLIIGLSAELYGLIGTISVYRDMEGSHFEKEINEIKSLAKDALEMSEDDIRKSFQNLRVKFQMKHMLGLRSLRCRARTDGDNTILSEFHTGEQVILTHPAVQVETDETGYVRMKGEVVNILGDSTIVMKPEGITG